MAYDLQPNNPSLPSFHMASDWLHLLEQCGSYFPFMSKGARWYMVFDERMTTHYHPTGDGETREPVTDTTYPAIICNCGFEVTEEESKVMAHIARNYVAIQRTLNNNLAEENPIRTWEHLNPFPKKIRSDWVDNFEQFAEWAEQSQGFKVY